MIKLSQEFGAHTGRQLTFDQPRVRLGRAPTNEIAFDPNVDLDSSGSHCEIVSEDGAHYVVDQNSRNGTYLNGTRVQKQRLSHGDLIECGRGGPRIRVELPNAPPKPLAAPATAMPAYAAPGAPAGTEAMPAYSPALLASRPGVAAPMAGYSQGPSQRPPAAFGPGAPGFPPSANAFAPAGAAAPGFLPMPPPSAPRYDAASPSGMAFAPVVGMPAAHGSPGAFSPGVVAVARLPQNAQVGKRTMAMMIDAALIQAGAKKTSGGTRVAIGLMAMFVVVGFVVGGYFLWAEKQDTDERLAHFGDGNAGERIAQQSEAAIYMLASVLPGTNPQGFCTGFSVTPDLIATNAHCVDAAQELITTRGRSIVALRNNGRGAQIPLQPLYRDPRFHNPAMGSEGSGYDVGILRAAQALPTQVHLVAMNEVSRVTPGANIYVYGFPGMTMNEVSPVATITAGILSRMTDFFDRAADDPSQAQKIQHSAQTTSGSSGSPIFLASGEVIGVNAGSLADEEHQSMLDPATGRRVSVEVNRSSNFKYGMRADLIRAAVQAIGESAP